MNQASAKPQPPMSPSDEANVLQLQFAREQGDAYKKALDHMAHQEAHGAEQRAGDYVVAYAVENAEGMYMQHGGELLWHNPQDENAHVEISVRDASDNRFIPGLNIKVTVLDRAAKEIGTYVQPFLWHPWLYHYGRNWKLPGDGEYTLRVHIEAPDFMRHDRTNGMRYAKPLDVEFKNVTIKTGQKKS